jgi:hypothetical protein
VHALCRCPAYAVTVFEAFTWATADDQIGTEFEHGPCDIAAGSTTSSSARNRKRTSAGRLYAAAGRLLLVAAGAPLG